MGGRFLQGWEELVFQRGKNMLNYDLCLVDLCDEKVRSEIHRRKLKTGCFLLLLGRIWELRSNGWKGLKEILVLLNESF